MAIELMDGCKHRPISNGYSMGSHSPPTTWCGYCKRSVKVDEAWANAHYDTVEGRVKDQVDRGYAGWRALDEVRRDRERLLEALRTFDAATATP